MLLLLLTYLLITYLLTYLFAQGQGQGQWRLCVASDNNSAHVSCLWKWVPCAFCLEYIFVRLTHISMVDCTKVLCPHFDEIEILIPGDSPSIFYLWTKCEILIRYRNEKDDFIEAVNQTWLSYMSGCANALCPFQSSTKVLSLAVDLIPWPTWIFIASNLIEVLVLFTPLQNITILSIIVT